MAKTKRARRRTWRPPERVLSSCFGSAVRPASAQSTAAPASPVVPVASRFSRRRRTNPKVITLLNCPLPLPDVVVVPAACAPPRPERAGHRVPASVPAVAPVKISPLYRRRNIVNRDLSFPDLGCTSSPRGCLPALTRRARPHHLALLPGDLRLPSLKARILLNRSDTRSSRDTSSGMNRVPEPRYLLAAGPEV